MDAKQLDVIKADVALCDEICHCTTSEGYQVLAMVRDHLDTLMAEVERLEREVAAATADANDADTTVEEVFGWLKNTFQQRDRGPCIWCGRLVTREEAGNHWASCEKHPAKLEVERLRAALEQYANHDNWEVLVNHDGPRDVFGASYHGWELAERALRGEG